MNKLIVDYVKEQIEQIKKELSGEKVEPRGKEEFEHIEDLFYCGTQLLYVSEEEAQGYALLAADFVKRLKANPEYIPNGLPPEYKAILDNPPKHFEPQYSIAFREMAEAEVYFQYKAEMYKQGILIVHAKYDWKWASDERRMAMATDCIEFIKAHPKMYTYSEVAKVLNRSKIIRNKEDAFWVSLLWLEMQRDMLSQDEPDLESYIQAIFATLQDYSKE